jgi:aspartyl-tRNA(Asn)/glutamyl-tRNA(Gln) amidotransferase subunit A
MLDEKYTIEDLHLGLKSKKFSAVEVVEKFLERIEEKDKNIFSYLLVDKEGALAQARNTDKRLSQNLDLRELEGVPMAIKDNILVKDLRCTAGSKILENFIAPYDATVIRKLKDAGAIILGKTNLDEFAMGSSTENSAFGVTHNPYDFDRVPGGSSGGSAAAVASFQCLGALGSDTGGSIRQPASFCGVVGLRPTYGRVSRFGAIAMASSLDQIGPFGNNVSDVRKIFHVLSGQDDLDSTTAPQDVQPELFKKDKNSALKIGLPKEYFSDKLHPQMRQKMNEAIEIFTKIGAEMKEVSLPTTDISLAAYYVLVPAEVSANLARYDGVKYGYSKKSENLMENYLKTRQHGFGKEVRRRIFLGTYVLSAGYYDAYYIKAQKVRTKIIEDFKNAFSEVDFLLTPTTPTPAFKIGEMTKDPLAMYLSDTFTVPTSVAGLPAISVPFGKVSYENKNLPFGAQIISRWFDEDHLLDLAEKFEQFSKI